METNWWSRRGPAASEPGRAATGGVIAPGDRRWATGDGPGRAARGGERSSRSFAGRTRVGGRAAVTACTIGCWSRGVAQPGRALALGARCRWFESSRPDHLSASGGSSSVPHTAAYTVNMKFKRITTNPRQMGGAPCLRGLRIPVATVVALVAEGQTTEGILALYPDLEADDVREALLFAAEAVRERALPLATGE